MPAAMEEFAVCRDLEGPHHRCRETQKKLLGTYFLMLYNISPQPILWRRRLGILTPAVECTTHCISLREAFMELFALQDVEKRIRSRGWFYLDNVVWTWLNKKDEVERVKEMRKEIKIWIFHTTKKNKEKVNRKANISQRKGIEREMLVTMKAKMVSRKPRVRAKYGN